MDRYQAIKSFCLASETLNFRETASRLSISPSVITRLINELEEELGEPLFKRSTRSIRLTSFGEQFLPKARQWLHDSEKLFQTPHHQSEMRGVVRITAPAWRELDSIQADLLQQLAPYPELTIDWRNDMSKLDRISERIDIGLRIGLEPDPNFIVLPIAEVGDLLVASTALLAQLGQPKDLDDLCRRYPFCGQINDNTGQMWDFMLNENISLFPQQIKLLSNNPYAGLQAILQGQCVGLVSDFLCQPHLHSGQLQVLFGDIPIQKWSLYLYRPQQTLTPNRVLKVFDLLTEMLRARFHRE